MQNDCAALPQSCIRTDQANDEFPIDLGFALTHYKGKLPKRLIDTGGLAKKDRITHRMEITHQSRSTAK